EFHLKQTRLVIAAVEHGKIPKMALFVKTHGENFIDHPLKLGLLVGAANDADRVAQAQLTPQGFLEYVGIIVNQVVGGAQDAGGGTVILFQLDYLELGKVFLKLSQV